MHIDWWTLGLQAVNVLILLALLRHFFWRPVSAMIARRVAVAQSEMDAAAAKAQQAELALAEVARTREGFARERAAILEDARVQATHEHAARLAATEAEIVARNAAEAAERARQAAEAEAEWHRRATDLAVQIASRLLAGVEGVMPWRMFLARLITELGQLPPAERAAIARDGEVLDIVSATALSPEEQAECAAALRTALGTLPDFQFHQDADLIAGLELRGPHTVIANSLQANLVRIQQELAHDDGR